MTKVLRPLFLCKKRVIFCAKVQNILAFISNGDIIYEYKIIDKRQKILMR